MAMNRTGTLWSASSLCTFGINLTCLVTSTTSIALARSRGSGSASACRMIRSACCMRVPPDVGARLLAVVPRGCSHPAAAISMQARSKVPRVEAPAVRSVSASVFLSAFLILLPQLVSCAFLGSEEPCRERSYYEQNCACCTTKIQPPPAFA